MRVVEHAGACTRGPGATVGRWPAPTGQAVHLDGRAANGLERVAPVGLSQAQRNEARSAERHVGGAPSGGGQDESAPIQVWVTNASAMRADASPEAWLGQLKSDFGSAPQTLQVVSHPKDAEAGWRKAIQDAEQQHGIRSAPNAPVVLWPPEG